MLKAVCFDLDDTIYPHNDFELTAFKQIAILVANEYDIELKIYYKELVNLFEQKHTNRMFDAAIKGSIGYIPNGWNKFVIKKILPAYRHHKPQLKPFEDTIQLIKFFKQNNLLIVLITNGNTQMQNNKINCLGIRKLFDKIYISDAFMPPARKPSLMMFKKFLSDVKLQGKECLYIGDDLEKDGVCENLGIVFMKKMN